MNTDQNDSESLSVLIGGRLRCVGALLGPPVTRLNLGELESFSWVALKEDDPRLPALGIVVSSGRCTILVRTLEHSVGKVVLTGAGSDGLLIIDNRDWQGTLNLTARLKGDRCTIVICGLDGVNAALNNVFLRAADQVLIWGYGASAVDARIEMEGQGRVVVVGDDALISSGVWIRNHDMHGIHDLATMKQTNEPCDTIVERHVWLGQDTLVLRCERIGAGSIVAAKALANRAVDRAVVVGGLPCRVLKRQTSWSRSLAGFTRGEREQLELIQSLPESIAQSVN